MNILAIADRNPNIDIKQVVHSHNIDIIITLGDLERQDLLSLAEIINIPKIGVYGNHCSGSYMEELGIKNMHLTTTTYKGVTFGGFQGCVRYKENPSAIMYTQEEATLLMQDFPPVDVFICHCPPRGINDEEETAHQGFDALHKYIDKNPPKLLLHGHTYPTEDNIVTQHGTTRVEYVHQSKIITIESSDNAPVQISPELYIQTFRTLATIVEDAIDGIKIQNIDTMKQLEPIACGVEMIANLRGDSSLYYNLRPDIMKAGFQSEMYKTEDRLRDKLEHSLGYIYPPDRLDKPFKN